MPDTSNTNVRLQHSQVRTWLLLIFGVLAIFFLFKSYPTPTPTNLSRSRKARGVPRIKKVSMLYGEYNPLYERAIRSHNRHNEKFDYPFDVLRHDVSGGYWNKPSYLMSLVVAELAKPVEERVEWLMWVDADLVHINPSIPLEIFLPPHDFENIHYLGNKDQNGLNTGTFFLHVHEWSVKMLAKTIAFPMFRPDIDLHTSIDQEAMQHIFNESDFAPHVLFQPRPWYNTYEFHHGYEGKKGFMLVHFPGLEEDRWVHMDNWLDTVERHPGEWDVPWEETHYPKEIEAFWKTMREARDKLREAYRLRETLQNEGRLGELGHNVEGVMDRVASVLLFESDQPETVEKAYQELKSALESRQSSTKS